MKVHEQEVVDILCQRDGMSADDAEMVIEDFNEELEAMLDMDPGLEDVSILVEDYFGLEPDYADAFLAEFC